MEPKPSSLAALEGLQGLMAGGIRGGWGFRVWEQPEAKVLKEESRQEQRAGLMGLVWRGFDLEYRWLEE